MPSPVDTSLPPPTVARRLRVLLVDDDPAMLRSLRRKLADDYDVWTAGSTEAVLALIFGGVRFDAIVSDVWMPEVEGDGMHLQRRVREMSPRQAERMVFITGGGLPERLRSFLEGELVVEKTAASHHVSAAIELISGRCGGPIRDIAHLRAA